MCLTDDKLTSNLKETGKQRRFAYESDTKSLCVFWKDYQQCSQLPHRQIRNFLNHGKKPTPAKHPHPETPGCFRTNTMPSAITCAWEWPLDSQQKIRDHTPWSTLLVTQHSMAEIFSHDFPKVLKKGLNPAYARVCVCVFADLFLKIGSAANRSMDGGWQGGGGFWTHFWKFNGQWPGQICDKFWKWIPKSSPSFVWHAGVKTQKWKQVVLFCKISNNFFFQKWVWTHPLRPISPQA